VVNFILQRCAWAVLQVLLVGTVVFALLHLLPGDPALIIIGSESTPDPKVVKAVRERMGLNDPLYVQYADWLSGLTRLDLGRSLVDNSPVRNTISHRLPRTLQLVGTGILLATLFGIPLGVISALTWNSIWDRLLSLFGAVGISLPVYVFGMLLVLGFGVELKWLPVAGYEAPGEDFRAFLEKLILPAITLSLGPTAIITRVTRSSMLEVRGQEYVITARAKGLRERIVIYRHMLRNALIPVVTVIGLQVGTLIGGTVLVEYIFNWPGLSTLLLRAVQRRDYPTVQGVVMVSASFFILINLAVDILYGFIDPRISRSRSGGD
jgi:peptide/nickel transport system permease protein